MEKRKTNDFVLLAMFVAIIIVMSFVPFIGYIPLGFMNATIIHVPVIIGSLLLGPKKGAVLGLVFGLTSLWNNTFNPNATSFVFSPFCPIGEPNFWSLVICLVPRILIGITPHYTYKLLKKAAEPIKLAAAGIVGSLTNTLLVMNGIYLFFGKEYAAAKDVFSNIYTYILSIIGMFGVPEAIVAAILSAAVVAAVKKYQKS